MEDLALITLGYKQTKYIFYEVLQIFLPKSKNTNQYVSEIKANPTLYKQDAHRMLKGMCGKDAKKGFFFCFFFLVSFNSKKLRKHLD